MSIGNIDAQRLKALSEFPGQIKALAHLIIKASQKKEWVRVVRLIKLSAEKGIATDSPDLFDSFANAGLPDVSRAHFVSHMSGLRGLFVWKQKATTDAPDTHNA